MTDNKKVLIGVCKTLEGLTDIMESLPETAENVDIWQSIEEASQNIKQIIKGKR